MKNHYARGIRSLQKFCADKIVELNGTLSNPMIFDFEAHASAEEIPENDLIGTVGYEMAFEGKLVYYSAIIVVATASDDEGLGRLRAAMNVIVNDLVPDNRIPLYDHETVDPVGNLVVAEVHVLEVDRTATLKPYQGVAIQLRTDQAAH